MKEVRRFRFYLSPIFSYDADIDSENIKNIQDSISNNKGVINFVNNITGKLDILPLNKVLLVQEINPIKEDEKDVNASN